MPSACGDSTYAAPDQELLAVTPDEAAEDSCNWEAPMAQNADEENVAENASARASFSVAQKPGSAIQSIARHQAQGNGWNSRVEFRNDSLARKQLSWTSPSTSSGTWRVLAGDMNDPAMPIWPRWLPRRALPIGWSATPESDELISTTSIPQGLGAGVSTDNWKAYAVSAWDPVQGSGVPPWEKPWELHQFTAGVMTVLPWFASLQLSETRITRNGQDSVADQLVAAGLTSPQQRLALNGAWSSSRQNQDGGYALGAKWTQPFVNSGQLQITLRQRSNDWISVWDPTYSPTADHDSTALAGAGEGIANLHLPFRMNDGKGLATSEAWASWNPQTSAHKLGTRGTVEWHRRDLFFEMRALHREWTYASGTSGFHNFLAMDTRLGRYPEWRAGVYRIWEKNSTRNGLSLAADAKWSDLRIRPGVLLESDKDQNLSSTASLWMHWRITKSWRIETDGSVPCGSDFSLSQMRWRATLRYVK